MIQVMSPRDVTRSSAAKNQNEEHIQRQPNTKSPLIFVSECRIPHSTAT
jgi:hypothetical protein